MIIEISISAITQQPIFFKESDVFAAKPDSITGGIKQVVVIVVQQIVFSVYFVNHYVIENVPFSSCHSALEDSVYLSIESYIVFNKLFLYEAIVDEDLLKDVIFYPFFCLRIETVWTTLMFGIVLSMNLCENEAYLRMFD